MESRSGQARDPIVLGYYEKEVIWLADRREFCNVLNKYKKDLKLDARKMDTLLPKSETVTFSLSNKTRNRLISYENLLKIFKEKIRAITIENLPKMSELKNVSEIHIDHKGKVKIIYRSTRQENYSAKTDGENTSLSVDTTQTMEPQHKTLIKNAVDHSSSVMTVVTLLNILSFLRRIPFSLITRNHALPLGYSDLGEPVIAVQ